MSLDSNLDWVKLHLKPYEIKDMSVLDVGSRNWDMTISDYVNSCKPSKYVGIDRLEGPGVDVACDANDIVRTFGEKQFDIVICLEVLEHVKDWVKVVDNLKLVCKEGGVIIVTTRIYGYAQHGYPDDFWRYEFDDMMRIFSDCVLLAVEQDHEARGVYGKFRKPLNFNLADVGYVRLWSMKRKRKCFMEEGVLGVSS